MAESTQDPTVAKTYLDDWTKELASAAKDLGLPELTIATATVTADGGASVVNSDALASGVLFQLDASGVTEVPSNITTTTSVTLSNGDTDVRRHLIEIRET